MAIIVSVIVTSLVMMVAWNSTVMVQSTSNYMKEARAYYVAEGGLQRAYYRYKKDNTYRADPKGSPPSSLMTGTDTVDGQSYAYSVRVSGNPHSPVLVTSTATNGSVQGQVHVTLSGGGGTAATVAMGGGATFSSTSQLNVTGDLSVSGTINSSGTFNVAGNVDASGSIPAGVSATGTKNPNDGSITVPDVTTMYNSLTSGAYSIPSGNITTLDFVAHPVIMVSGNATLNMSSIDINGSGTLIVSGNVTTGTDMGTNGNPLTFNLVTLGTFTATNKWYVTGSLYSKGLIKFNNQTVINGVIVGNAGATLNNHHTFNFASPPAFDSRSGPLTAANYGGATP